MKPFTPICIILLFLALVSGAQNSDIVVERQWQSYRGYYANGILENTNYPDTWNLETNENIKWKVDIPGLALSCPVIWGDKLFITSAVSESDNELLRAGSYVSSNPVDDESEHEWVVYCFNTKTGEKEWEKIANKGIPMVKRHPKSTHANCTPATDGKHVLAFFGSEGLYCYTVEGELLWKKDFGRLHAGAFAEHREAIEWEFGSSPLIHKGVVLIQCDVRGDSFLGAYDIKTGKEIWKKTRDEHPGWCTPNIYKHKGRELVVVNGYKHRGAYDFETGEEIWRMSGGGDIPVPTPQIGEDLIFFNSAHGRYSPVMAIKKNAIGDITLEKDATTNQFVKWSKPRGGSYMHSLLLYKGLLYNVGWNGSVECIDALSGERVYKESLGGGETSIASPVASDGKVYVVGDKGTVFTIKAGRDYEVLAKNYLGGVSMVVPALTDNTIYFRTQTSLIAVSKE